MVLLLPQELHAVCAYFLSVSVCVISLLFMNVHCFHSLHFHDSWQREGGRIPRTVDCEAREDLVDSCVPGDLVTITGIVKVSHKKVHVVSLLLSIYVAFFIPTLLIKHQINANFIITFDTKFSKTSIVLNHLTVELFFIFILILFSPSITYRLARAKRPEVARETNACFSSTLMPHPSLMARAEALGQTHCL